MFVAALDLLMITGKITGHVCVDNSVSLRRWIKHMFTWISLRYKCVKILFLLTDWLIGWLIGIWSLAGLDLWKRMLLMCPSPWCSVLLVFVDVKLQVLSGKYQCGTVLVSFPHLHSVGQLVVHPPSRTVSHPKDKKLPWPLTAHPLSAKTVVTW